MSLVEYSGPTTTTPGSEQTLATTSGLKTRMLIIDTTLLSGTEYLEVRIKGAVLSGGTAGQILYTAIPAGLTSPIVEIYPVVQPQGGDITIKQINGSGHALPWVIVTLD